MKELTLLKFFLQNMDLEEMQMLVPKLEMKLIYKLGCLYIPCMEKVEENLPKKS